MKRSLIVTVAMLAFSFFASGSLAIAEDAAPAKESHEQHHPEGQAKETSKDQGMMGSMKMEDMEGMMHDCMSMHKDGKMCEHEAMTKCQENMKAGDCKKMMKESKKSAKKK